MLIPLMAAEKSSRTCFNLKDFAALGNLIKRSINLKAVKPE